MLHSTDPKIWTEVISREMSPLAVRAPNPSRFQSRVLSRSMSYMKVLHIHGTAQEFFRSSRQADTEALRYYSIALQINGRSGLRHNGHDSILEPGDVVVFDWLKPHAREFDEDFEMMTVLVPQHLVPRDARHLSAEAGRKISGDSAGGTLLTGLMRSLGSTLERVDTRTGVTALHSVVNLTSSALLGTSDQHHDVPALQMDELYHQARHFIRASLSNPALSPQAIAEALHVSVRTLHQNFHRHGTTIQTTIREERVRLAATELSSSDSLAWTLTSLAGRCGFAGASQFSRTFRAEMGVSPSEYRRAVLAGN